MVVPLRDWLLLRGRMRRVAFLSDLPLLSVGAELALLGLLSNDDTAKAS